MDKLSIIALQKIDCNCNDCIFMQRDPDKYKQSLIRHEKWQKNYFDIIKSNLIRKADEWKKKQELDKYSNLLKEADNMRFQFDKSTCAIQYGKCTKLLKDVSFIPNTCQLETQGCFEHRRKNLINT